MAKSFKNGVSLHRLLEASPLEVLRGFLAATDEGKYAEDFAVVASLEVLDEASAHKSLGGF